MKYVFMSMILTLLATAMARAGEPSAGDAAAIKGLQMSIHVEKTRYRADEPMVIEVAIKNTTEAEVFLGMSIDDWASFDFAVQLVASEAGGIGRMPLTKFGARRLSRFDAPKNIPIRLKAGEVRRYRFPLNRMVDMTLDGRYSVVVRRSIPGRPRQNPEGRVPAIEGDASPDLVSDELKVEVSDSASRD